MKVVVVLLLALNAALAAWWQGYLAPLLPAPGASEREPIRLERQLQPQAVSVAGGPAVTRPAAGASAPPPVLPPGPAAPNPTR